MIRKQDIIFDIILVLVILPYLYRCKKNIKYTQYCVYIIIWSHIIILYQRYLYNQSIQLSTLSEFISILIGYIIYKDGLEQQNQLLQIYGTIIMFGHIRKIILPTKVYYFG